MTPPFNLPYADTHAIVLPHVLRFNAVAGDTAYVGRLAAVLRVENAVDGFDELYKRIKAPRHLGDIGFTADDIATPWSASLLRHRRITLYLSPAMP